VASQLPGYNELAADCCPAVAPSPSNETASWMASITNNEEVPVNTYKSVQYLLRCSAGSCSNRSCESNYLVLLCSWWKKELVQELIRGLKLILKESIDRGLKLILKLNTCDPRN